MSTIVSRLLVRLALVTASLSWAGFVLTQTVADPARGERIATAVLADDAARAEIVAPISGAVVRATGLPVERQPEIGAEIDALLREPSGAQAFIDPFAGSWARMLGEDDPRPARFDLAPLTGRLAAAIPDTAGLLAAAEGAGASPDVLAADVGELGSVARDELGSVFGTDVPVPGSTAAPTLPSTTGPTATDAAGGLAVALPVDGVPLPAVRLGWLAGIRRGIAAAVVPLALVAAALAGIAFAVGERRRVLRRVGGWGIGAGALWLVIPPLLVWAARSWASGADAVVAVGTEAAVGGLRPVALVLVAGGCLALGLSFLPSLTPSLSGLVAEVDDRLDHGGRRVAAADVRPTRASAAPVPGAPARLTSDGRYEPTQSMRRPIHVRRTDGRPTTTMPATGPTPGPVASSTLADLVADADLLAVPPDDEPDGDDLWAYYTR